MTPKLGLAAILLLTSLMAHGQLLAASGKLFILNNSSRATLANSENPTATLAQADRVELTAANSVVNVKRCGTFGCLDPLGHNVRIEAIRQVNVDMKAQDLESGDREPCRVCIPAKTVPGNLEDYVNRIKVVAPQFE